MVFLVKFDTRDAGPRTKKERKRKTEDGKMF